MAAAAKPRRLRKTPHAAKTVHSRLQTMTMLQMEATECGAAALGSILGYYGKYIPLEELRTACGVTRDGVNALNVVKAARSYGMEADGYKMEIEQMQKEALLPCIVFWNFNHFVVVEGFGAKKIWLNDPAEGPRTVTHEEFDDGFTGVVLTFKPTAEFHPSGQKPSLLPSLRHRLRGLGTPVGFVVAAGFLAAVCGIMLPVFSKIFVDDILLSGYRDWLRPMLWAMGFTVLLQALLTWVQSVFLLRLQNKIALGESARFVRHVLRLPIEFFTQRYAGDIASRISINDTVANLLSGQLATTVVSMGMMIFYFALMLTYNVPLSLVGLATALMHFAALRWVARKRTDISRRLVVEQGKFAGLSMAGLGAIETMKATGGEAPFFTHLAGQQAKLVNAGQELGVKNQVLLLGPALLHQLNSVAVLVMGGYFVINGEMTLGMLVAFQMLMSNFIAPASQIVNLAGSLQTLQGDMNRLDDVLQYSTDPATEKEPAKPEEAAAAKLRGKLELRDLRFGYNRLRDPLIAHFNLTLAPGARVALVGPSGCGKSTMARLVSGLYEPWSGSVLFDGRARSEWPREVWSNSVAIVDQEISMFPASIRDNLTLWDPAITDEEMIRAARDACIHDEISMRPGGYESMVVEGGSNFSGGQLQRLEIARALARNPSVLILDEATSALDPATEAEIDANLRRRGCTCLIIAHRLSTVRDCDEIVVLYLGRVAERGTHEQLMRNNNIYARFIGDEE